MLSSAEITTLLDEALSAHTFSGYQCLAARGDEVVALSNGVTSYWSGGEPVGPTTLFDIGSVTKVVVTGSLAALAVQSEQLDLDDTVGGAFPELARTALASLSARDLLTHSSGLVGWYPLYEETDRRSLVTWLAKRAPDLVKRKPREKAEYSDLGFILLGLWLERLGESDLANLFESLVVRPLGLSEVRFGPVSAGNVAATEYRIDRGAPLQGEVFDENCARLGHIAGHAGLFASARGLLPWCRAWLAAVKGESEWLGQSTALLFTSPAGRVAGSSWAHAWDTKSPEGSSAGKLFSEKSFGHLGYPGCSVWIDPVSEGIAILLTNRVHPSRYDERIRALRPRAHDAMARLWEKAS